MKVKKDYLSQCRRFDSFHRSDNDRDNDVKVFHVQFEEVANGYKAISSNGSRRKVKVKILVSGPFL